MFCYFDMSVPQRCVGPLVTSPQRLLNAPWMQDTKDMGLQWTCECTVRRPEPHWMICGCDFFFFFLKELSSSLCRWSSGVIMYTLLAGSPPFWHRKQMLMLRMILAGTYDMSSPEWEDRSDTVKDLVGHLWNVNPHEYLGQMDQPNTLCLFMQISRMLVVDPKQRFTATDVLNHSFFSQYVVHEVRQFSPYRRFKVSIWSK